MAGITTPLALLWVVVGVTYQRKELQTAIRELSNQSAAQSHQADIATEGLRHQLDEAKRRRHVEWRAVQPHFTFGFQTGSSGGMNVSVEVKKNEIYNVRVKPEPAFKDAPKGGQRPIGHVEIGEEFHILIPEPLRENLPHDWIVTFEDKLGYEADVRIHVESVGRASAYQLTSGPIAASTGTA